MIIRDQRLVSGLSLWQGQEDGDGPGWSATVELTSEFHEHLRQHAVPLARDAIAHLKDNSLGLDLYTLLAYRLQRLEGRSCYAGRRSRRRSAPTRRGSRT